jgi:hypothetical protein
MGDVAHLQLYPGEAFPQVLNARLQMHLACTNFRQGLLLTCALSDIGFLEAGP